MAQLTRPGRQLRARLGQQSFVTLTEVAVVVTGALKVVVVGVWIGRDGVVAASSGLMGAPAAGLPRTRAPS